MVIGFSIKDKSFTADLSAPIDISIPLKNGTANPNCFYAPHPKFEPVRDGSFVGSMNEGGVVNFFNVFINPHGNGTHTECVGHISKEPYTINQCLKQFHFPALLISVPLEKKDEDELVSKEALQKACEGSSLPEVLVIRTLPNDDSKKAKQYSNTNPPYLAAEAMQWIVEQNVQHLVIDLPSVDREKDGGVLAAHHIFWSYPGNTREQCTITELVYIPEAVKDGPYLCNIQVTSIEMDASPSKVLLFPLS